MSERHLILGGYGFIGSQVAAELMARGSEVVVVGRAPAHDIPANRLPAGAEYRSSDLATADWDTLIEGASVVHHYAWTSLPASANATPARDIAENVVPTLGLLEALRHRGAAAPRLLFASSGGTVYGRLTEVPVPESHPLNPITSYGVGKASVEMYLHQYRILHGVDSRIARISNPFGARQSAARGQGAASAFIRRALAGEAIEVWGDGGVTRDYIHVSDLACGLAMLATLPLPAGPWTFNIGSGRGTSLNDLVAELERQLGVSLPVRRGAHRTFDVPVSVLDVGLARDVLGWTPRLSLAQGIARTIEELRAGPGRLA